MVYYSFKKIQLSFVYKVIVVFITSGFCQLMEAQCREKERDYTEIVQEMYNRLIADSLLASSDTFYVIPNDSCIKIKSSKKISSRYPQLVKGESNPVYLLNRAKHSKGKIVVTISISQLIRESDTSYIISSSGSINFYYMKKRGKYHLVRYKVYGI